jgi:hypothetical protein
VLEGAVHLLLELGELARDHAALDAHQRTPRRGITSPR